MPGLDSRKRGLIDKRIIVASAHFRNFMHNETTKYLAQRRLMRGLKAAGDRYFARPFSRKARIRILAFHDLNPITWSQLYPFFHHAEAIHRQTGAEIRSLPFEMLLDPSLASRAKRFATIDLVLLQPWFTRHGSQIKRAMGALERIWPETPSVFLDSYAHNDLRLAPDLPGTLRSYVKKSIFRNRSDYLRHWCGDTNLTDYYCSLYGIEAEPVDFSPPPEILPKLAIGPNFFTDPRFVRAFGPDGPPPQEGRDLDIQTRIGARGSAWYTTMRRHSIDAVNAIAGISTSPEGKVPYSSYMDEMRRSRLCFSPFGYGEVCWRDIEAFQAGAVLVKPDMGHLETAPELYEPDATYLPVRWDFADLEEVVLRALSDRSLRETIAREAHLRIAKYLAEGCFAEQAARILKI